MGRSALRIPDGAHLPLEKLLMRLMGMNWLFCFATPDQHLVISDDPCEMAFDPSARFNGVLTEGMEFHVPIARNLVFAAFDGDGSRSWSTLPPVTARAC